MVKRWSRQKSYHDPRHRNVEFQVGDFVFLKVSPMRGVMRFGKNGKLAPRFVGPFKILDRVGTRAYRIELPPSLTAIHNVFHVSMLRRWLREENAEIPLHEIELNDDLTFEVRPMAIIDRDFKVMRGRKIPLVKVRWSENEKDMTWELEEKIRRTHPELFAGGVPHLPQPQVNFVTCRAFCE